MLPLMTGLRFWKEELTLINGKLPADPLEVIHCSGGNEAFFARSRFDIFRITAFGREQSFTRRFFQSEATVTNGEINRR